MTANEGRELTPTRILPLVLQSVRGGEQTEATIRNAYEAVALVGHASMVAAGYRLVGLGEEHSIGMFASTSPERIHEHTADFDGAHRSDHEYRCPAQRVERTRHLCVSI